MTKTVLLGDWLKIKDLPLEIIDGDRGTTYPNGSELKSSGDCLFLSARNVTSNGFSFDQLQFISKDKDALLRKGKLKRDDVVLTTRGTLGNAALYDDSVEFDDARINSGMIIFRCNSEVLLPEYFYYLLKSQVFQDEVLNFRSGSAQPQLPIRDMENIKLPLPSLENQRNIINQIGTLDRKIELNRRMNKTLEKIGQALFKHYFIDNPDRKNWETKMLSEIASITIGRTPPRKESQWFSTNPSDQKWISIKDMGNAGVFITDTSEYLTKEAVEKFRVPIIPKDTVIISFKLTMGRVTITDEEMVSNEAIAHIKLNADQLSREYVYFFLKNFDYDSLGSTSSIATAANSEAIRKIKITIPDDVAVRTFGLQIKPIFLQILNLTKQGRSLTQLRDSLLPRLIDGRVRT